MRLPIKLAPFILCLLCFNGVVGKVEETETGDLSAAAVPPGESIPRSSDATTLTSSAAVGEMDLLAAPEVPMQDERNEDKTASREEAAPQRASKAESTVDSQTTSNAERIDEGKTDPDITSGSTNPFMSEPKHDIEETTSDAPKIESIDDALNSKVSTENTNEEPKQEKAISIPLEASAKFQPEKAQEIKMSSESANNDPFQQGAHPVPSTATATEISKEVEKMDEEENIGTKSEDGDLRTSAEQLEAIPIVKTADNGETEEEEPKMSTQSEHTTDLTGIDLKERPLVPVAKDSEDSSTISPSDLNEESEASSIISASEMPTVFEKPETEQKEEDMTIQSSEKEAAKRPTEENPLVMPTSLQTSQPTSQQVQINESINSSEPRITDIQSPRIDSSESEARRIVATSLPVQGENVGVDGMKEKEDKPQFEEPKQEFTEKPDINVEAEIGGGIGEAVGHKTDISTAETPPFVIPTDETPSVILTVETPSMIPTNETPSVIPTAETPSVIPTAETHLMTSNIAGQSAETTNSVPPTVNTSPLTTMTSVLSSETVTGTHSSETVTDFSTGHTTDEEGLFVGDMHNVFDHQNHQESTQEPKTKEPATNEPKLAEEITEKEEGSSTVQPDPTSGGGPSVVITTESTTGPTESTTEPIESTTGPNPVQHSHQHHGIQVPETVGGIVTSFSLRFTNIDFNSDFNNLNSGAARKLHDQIHNDLNRAFETTLGENYVGFELVGFRKGSLIVDGRLLSRDEIGDPSMVGAKLEDTLQKAGGRLGGNLLDLNSIYVDGILSKGGAQLNQDGSTTAAANTGYIVGGSIAIGVLIMAFVVFAVIVFGVNARRRKSRNLKLKEQISLAEHGRSPFGAVGRQNGQGGVNLMSYGSSTPGQANANGHPTMTATTNSPPVLLNSSQFSNP